MRRAKKTRGEAGCPTASDIPDGANSPSVVRGDAAWKAVGPGWRPLFGSYRDLGFSFEWHEFTAKEEFDWSRSFHPGSVELCLNLGREREIDRRTGTPSKSCRRRLHFIFRESRR